MARVFRRNGDGKKQGSIERTISIVYERGLDGCWTARLGERPGIEGVGGSIAQARKRLLARMPKEARDLAELPARERILLPPAGRDAIHALDRARAELIDAERMAVASLVRGLGLTVHDAAEALGLTMRRVVHLAGEVADVEAERKYGRRARAAARTTRAR